VVKPIISPEFNSRCQVDLIDFQSHPEGKYGINFNMVIQYPLSGNNGNHYVNSQENSIQNTIPTIQSNNSIHNRRKAKENLENQAAKMKTWSDKKLKPAEVGATVRV